MTRKQPHSNNGTRRGAIARTVIRREAVDWHVSLGEAKEKQSVQFSEALTEWVLRSAVHLQAFLSVAQVCADLQLLTGKTYAIAELVGAARAESEDDGNVIEMPLK